jgi:hypothetical protein
MAVEDALGLPMSTSAIRLHNTMTQRLEPLEPLEPGHVRIYVCGMTTYDHAHAGHARTYIAFDVLVRFLRTRGYRVTLVRNVTDVDDKILHRALEKGESPLDLSKRMSRINDEELRAIGCLEPEFAPRVSESIADIVSLIEKLIAKGLSYVVKTDKGSDVCSPERGSSRATQNATRSTSPSGRGATMRGGGTAHGGKAARGGTSSARRWPRRSCRRISTSMVGAWT